MKSFVLVCFCKDAELEIRAIYKSGVKKVNIQAKCPACKSSYEFRNWPLSEEELEIAAGSFEVNHDSDDRFVKRVDTRKKGSKNKKKHRKNTFR